jgi:MFS family permease
VVAAVLAGLRRPFPRYWLSAFLVAFGDGVRLAAFPLLAVQFTDSPTAVAAVTATQSLPWLVMGAGLGVLVDRFDRRRLMVIVDSTRAVIVAGLAVAVLTHAANLPLLYVAAFATGLGSALRRTAEASCLPELVEPDRLEEANGRLIAGQIVGNELAGPAAGGALFGVAAVLPFAVNAGGLGVAVLLLLTLPSVFRPPSREPGTAPGSLLVSAGWDFGEGVHWLWRHRDLRDLTIAVGVISAMDAAWFAVLVLYVVHMLHQKPSAYGLLLAVAAIGGIAAGAAGARLTRRLGPWRSVVTAGAAMAGTQTVLGLTSQVTVAAAMLLVSSAAFAVFNMTAVTMRQRLVPAPLLGRVTSLYGTVAQGAEALGAIAGGALAAAVGIRAPMLAGAVPIVAVTVTLALRHRRGRSGFDDGAHPRMAC